MRPRDKSGKYISMPKINVGDKFGRLTVIDDAGIVKAKRRYLCSCSCGSQLVVLMDSLLRGKTKSCGCLRKEITAENHIRHGQRSSRLYGIWRNMKSRCLNPNATRFENHGGRGITLCDDWMSFESFYNWAINNGYQDNLTIERVDNDGGYCPENCKWGTNYDQQRNKRNNHFIEFNGERKTLKEWSEILGLSYSALILRLNRLKWSVDKAFTTPVRKIKHREVM